MDKQEQRELEYWAQYTADQVDDPADDHGVKFYNRSE